MFPPITPEIFPPITPEIMDAVRISPKTPRMIMGQRDDASFRPLRRSVADGLAAIEREALRPIGPVRGSTSRTVLLCGHNVSLILMVGETETETFTVGFPFATTFKATSLQDGKLRTYQATQFDGSYIDSGGTVQLHNRALVRARDGGDYVKNLEFDAADLPFRLTELQLDVLDLLIPFLNETGIAQQQLGRKVSTGNHRFADLFSIKLQTLNPFQTFIDERWNTMRAGVPPPSRETIAATLEALGVRARNRGRRAFRPAPSRSELERQLSTQFHLRKPKV